VTTAVVGDASTAAGSKLSSAPAGRRTELDAMRAFVVAGLVVFHCAVVFAAGTSWFVTDPRPSAGFTVFLLWGSLWGMPLLFVVSGIGVCHALRTRSAAAFVRERVARLLVPLVVGMALLVAPMFYLEQLGKPGFSGSYGRFWLRVLNVPAIAEGLLPDGSWSSGGDTFDPAHLWFLYVLLLFSLILLPLFAFLRRPRGLRLTGRLAGYAERHPLVAVGLAAVPVMVVEAVFGPDDNTGGWERVAYLFPFLYGFLIASEPRLETALRRTRRPAAAAAVSATAALVAWAAALDASGDSVMTSASPAWSALQGLAGWSWIAAILGYAGSLTSRRKMRGSVAAPETGSLQRRAGRYANEAVLPFYLLHEPVIVAGAWLIVRWNAPILGKYLVLVVMSFAGTLALYELLIRRFPISRRLAGMKAPTRSTTARSPDPGREASLLAAVSVRAAATAACGRFGRRFRRRRC
jgi:peptidoglycan/LPS O-acetylase OafA/YrhL